MRSFKKDGDGWVNFHDFAGYLVKQFDLKLINYLGNNLPDRVHDCIVDVLIEPFFLFGMLEIKGEIYDERRIYKVQSFKLMDTGTKMLSILSPRIIPINTFGSFFNMH